MAGPGEKCERGPGARGTNWEDLGMFTPDSEYYCPDFDLGVFRYAAARYVKLLIRARWKVDPGFISKEDLAAWELQDIEDDTIPAGRLLDDAARALAHLNRYFLPGRGSGGIPVTDESTPEGRLLFNVAFLAE